MLIELLIILNIEVFIYTKSTVLIRFRIRVILVKVEGVNGEGLLGAARTQRRVNVNARSLVFLFLRGIVARILIYDYSTATLGL